MERIIETIEKDLKRIIDGIQPEVVRKELGDSVNIRFVRMIVFSLQWASAGYQSGLRFAGMKFGKRMGMLCDKSELSLILGEIKVILEYLRGGKAEIQILNEGREANLILKESALTCGVPNVSQNLCFFEEGFVDGYLDGVIHKLGSLAVAGKEITIIKVNVEETKCIGKGDNSCIFSVQF